MVVERLVAMVVELPAGTIATSVGCWNIRQSPYFSFHYCAL
jgi:hypothetical protein